MKEYLIKKKIDEELNDLVVHEEMWTKIWNDAKQNENSEDTKVISYPGKRKLKTVVKVSILAASLVIVSVASVMGMEYHRKHYKTVISEKHQSHFTDSNVNSSEVVEQLGKDIVSMESGVIDGKKQGDQSDLYEIIWGEYTAAEHSMSVKFTMQSKDRSPILTENENKVPHYFSVGFEQLRVDGNNPLLKATEESVMVIGSKDNVGERQGKRIYAMLTDVSEDLSRLEFELTYENNDVSLAGEYLTIQIGNLSTRYYLFEDIDAGQSIGELIANGKAETDFISNTFSSYDNYSYTGYLPKGENKIYFSSQYPECYIDNFGYIEDPMYDGTKAFVFSIVCDEQSKKELLDLTIQNDINGYRACAGICEHEDGRIELMYGATRDSAYDEIHKGSKYPMDTTEEQLNHLWLKKKVTAQSDINEVIPCGYEMTFHNTMNVEDAKQNVVAKVPGDDGKVEFAVEEVHIEALKIVLKGKLSCDEDYDLIQFGLAEKPVVYFTDGSSMETKLGDTLAANMKTKDACFEFVFSSLINPQDVSKIVWKGETILEK